MSAAQHHRHESSQGQMMEGDVGRGRDDTHARDAFTATDTRDNIQPTDTHHNNTTTNNNYWLQQQKQHEEEMNSITMRHDAFLGGMEHFPTPVATNTNYNNMPIGGVATAGNNHNNSENSDKRNSVAMMDRRDSLLGLAGRIHPPRQDNGTMNFNNRRGSMGSLSEGIAAGAGDSGNDRNNQNTGINTAIHSINHNTNYWNNDRSSTTINSTNNSNSTNNNNDHAEDHARINYLAARAQAAQMIAVEESKRLEENLMRLEMRRVMMTKQRQEMQQQQQQQQQGVSEQQGVQHQQESGEQHQQLQQDGARRNSQDGQTDPPLPLPYVNNTNYNTMNMANATETAPRNVAQAKRQSHEDETLMALAQQAHRQFNSQGQFHNNQFHNNHQNRMMDHSNHTQMQGKNNNNNLHGYLQATAQNGNDARSATMPQNNIHNTYQQRQQQQQQQTQTQNQQQTPSAAIPNTPRRPLSAYNIFFSEIRSELLKAADDEKDEDEDKETQEQEPSTDKLREAQVVDNVETTTPMDKNKQFESFADNLAKTRLNKDPKKRAHRKTHGKVAFVSLAKTVGQKWRALPDEKKKKYQDLALADKERYRKEKMTVANAMREEVKRWKKDENDRILMNMM